MGFRFFNMRINFQISSDNYQIRSFKPSDKISIVKYANNYNIFKNLRDLFPHPYTNSDAEEWLKIVCNQTPEQNFAIANKKELIGGIGLAPQNDVNRFSAEIGYWLAEPFWGKGITTKTVKIFIEFTFKNFHFNRIFANVFEGNISSEKVLQKAGFELEGKLKKAVYKEGRFLDQYVYSILKRD